MGNAQTQKPVPPRALLSLLLAVIKRSAASIKTFRWPQIVQAFIAFLIIFVLNFYLVVFLNNGFVYRRDLWYNFIMAIRQTRMTSSVFWAVTFFVIGSQIGRIKTVGIKKYALDWAATPSWLIQSIQNASGKALSIFLFWLVPGMLLAFWIKNPYTMIALAVGVLFSLAAQLRGGLFCLIFAISLDIRWHMKSDKNKINVANLFIMLLGLFCGLLLAAFIPFQPLSLLIAAGLFFIVAIVFLVVKPNKVQAALVFAFCLCLVLALSDQSVHAHDGGWREAGGTWGDWLGSEGAGTATAEGVLPGGIGAFFSMIGSMVSGALQGLIPKAPPGGGVAGPGVIDAGIYVNSIISAGRKGTPRDAQRAAAMGWQRWIPGAGRTLEGYTSSVLDMGGHMAPRSRPSRPSGRSGSSGGGSGRRRPPGQGRLPPDQRDR